MWRRRPTRQASLGPTEIGPKTAFFGPIPAEMGANWPKARASSLAFAAAETLEISQIQG